MSTLRAAAQQALNALEEYQSKGAPFWACDAAVTALRAALAQQEQEPSVCARCGGLVYDPVWVAQSDPPRREWQGLTEEERAKIIEYGSTLADIASAIEQALKERNNG